MIYTTLNRIHRHSPCPNGWRVLLEHLGKKKGDREPVSFSAVLICYGLYDALLCTRAEPKYARKWRLFGVWCARKVQHLMDDPRSIAAIDVAERYAHGNATDDELEAAHTESWKAVQEAPSGTASAAARESAHGTTYSDASLSAYHAAIAAPYAIAKCATRPVESDTFMQAAIDEQASQFLRVVLEIEE